MTIRILLIMGFLLIYSSIFSQDLKLTGTVQDENNEAIAGVNIQVKETILGTTSDDKGTFILSVESLPAVLVFTFIGYETQVIEIGSTEPIKVVLKEDIFQSEDVVVLGSRFIPRTSITSPVPIDNVKMADLRGTGQITTDKMLSYVVPSFNSTQQTISDATAHFDPADLRGLGPSRTLVLINGKRKNPSSLVYINDTPGKGDVGVDMNSIPVNAIKRIEVMRDGASAQYGSDAIAGVINVILNDAYEKTDINVYSGVTQEGDGFQFGASVNTGFKIGEKGFFNISTGYLEQEKTNREGEPGKDDLFGVDASNAWIRANPDLGMNVGLPNMSSANIFFNSAIQLNDFDEIYSFGGLVYRNGQSYALYRAPYWVPDEYFLKHEEGTTYQGFQPTFETDIFDSEWTLGFRSQKMGWKYDLSYTYGSNSVDYSVGNSINLDLGEASPTQFSAGGYEFINNIINFDISKLYFDKLNIGLGTEFRQENFITNAGEEASYFGAGAQSFPGLQPQNALNKKRTNVGAYLDLGYDATENLFVGAATRYENYSDFGTSNTYKVNGRLKTNDNKYSVRGSFSTGFRAPSLHQIYLSNIQTLISGGTISNQGTFDNNSPVLRKLGVGKLKEEETINMSFGFAAIPLEDLFLSIDYFKIDIDDRIVYSSSIASDDTTTTVGGILNDNNITSLKFFINAANTSSQGVDIVANYKIDKLKLNAAATFAEHSIEGKINTPDVLEQDGVDIFDRKEQSRLVSARPSTKIIFGANYDLNPFMVGISATYFGEVEWKHANNGLNGADVGNGPLPTDDAAYDQIFAGKTLFDLNASYRYSDDITLSIHINNLLDTYPDAIDTKGDFVTDLGGRFKYPWEVNQFGFNGRVILGSINLSL